MSYTPANPKFSSTILTDQVAAAVPAPKAGSHKVIDRNGALFLVDSTGSETPIGSGAGELNLISNPSTANGWVASNTGVTVATSTTASDLPLAALAQTALKLTPVSSTDYARYRFTMPEALKNLKLKWEWWARPLAGYALGDFKIEVHTNTTSNYAGTDATLALSTDISGVTSLPLNTGKFTTTFQADSSTYYELRIIRVAGTTAYNTAAMVVGPGIQPQGAALSRSISYTPTVAGCGTVSSVAFQYDRAGEKASGTGIFTCGTVAGSAASFTLPYSWLANETRVIGRWIRVNSTGTTRKTGPLFSTATSNVIQFGSDDYTTAASPLTALLGNTAFSNSDVVYVNFNGIVISDLIGSGTVNIVQNDVEYASSTTGTWDAAATSANVVYGPNGSPISGALTSDRQKVVAFQTPIQVTDKLEIEFLVPSTNVWIPQSAAILGLPIGWAAVNFGATITSSAAANQAQVTFYRYAGAGTTYNSLTGAQDWSASIYSRWRLKKTTGGQAVGFGLAASGSSGLINNYQEDDTTLAAVTWQGNLGGSASAATAVKITRVGRLVTVEIPTNIAVTTASSSVSINSNTALPTWARPVATKSCAINSYNNGAYVNTTLGVADIGTDGVIKVYRDISRATAYANAVAGHAAFIISYSI